MKRALPCRVKHTQSYGVLTSLTLDLAGVGLCAKTNLEELFNFTIQKVGCTRP